MAKQSRPNIPLYAITQQKEKRKNPLANDFAGKWIWFLAINAIVSSFIFSILYQLFVFPLGSRVERILVSWLLICGVKYVAALGVRIFMHFWGRRERSPFSRTRAIVVCLIYAIVLGIGWTEWIYLSSDAFLWYPINKFFTPGWHPGIFLQLINQRLIINFAAAWIAGEWTKDKSTK